MLGVEHEPPWVRRYRVCHVILLVLPFRRSYRCSQTPPTYLYLPFCSSPRFRVPRLRRVPLSSRHVKNSPVWQSFPETLARLQVVVPKDGRCRRPREGPFSGASGDSPATLRWMVLNRGNAPLRQTHVSYGDLCPRHEGSGPARPVGTSRADVRFRPRARSDGPRSELRREPPRKALPVLSFVGVLPLSVIIRRKEDVAAGPTDDCMKGRA